MSRNLRERPDPTHKADKDSANQLADRLSGSTPINQHCSDVTVRTGADGRRLGFPGTDDRPVGQGSQTIRRGLAVFDQNIVRRGAAERVTILNLVMRSDSQAMMW